MKREAVPSPSSPALEPGPSSAGSVGTCSIPAVFHSESSRTHPVQMPSEANGIYVYAYMPHWIDKHIIASAPSSTRRKTLY